jgi:hypothetical protein
MNREGELCILNDCHVAITDNWTQRLLPDV